MAIYPSPEQIQSLLTGPPDQPVVMVNLLRFKPRADPPDDGLPRGRVNCDASCDVGDFTVPASKPLRLKGVPAPGDVGVIFDGDCNEDGTVLLDTATFPDCALNCDCSSGAN